jgi:hypothetical protein
MSGDANLSKSVRGATGHGGPDVISWHKTDPATGEGTSMSDYPGQPQPQGPPADAEPGQPAYPPVMPGPPAMPAPPEVRLAPGPPAMPGPSAPSAVERVRWAVQRRGESDYIFGYWTALGWTVLTLGIYGFYVFYQLVRRMRDHNARRLELLDAAFAAGWEQAGRQGVQQELAPSFQRGAGHLAALRQMTGDFREPAIWVVLAVLARGIVEIIAFVLLDQDLVRHSQAEAGAEQELSLIYGRLGQRLSPPDSRQVKSPDNYVGRIVVAIVTFGIYMLWWYWDQMQAPNRHFESNWAREDELVNAVHAFR